MNKNRDLKDKLREKKIRSKERGSIKSRKKYNEPKAYAKGIKAKNNKPNGVANLKNRPGNIIDVKQVQKYYVNGYNPVHILKNVNFSIKKGAFVVILGESGSGKSTLLNCISGLDRPTDGNIIVNNVNISALKDGELTTFRRNNVGFIFQSFNLLPELNVEDNINIGRILQTDGNKRLDIKQVLDQMNLSGYEKQSVQKLSGGQQQRVAIARAITKNPAVIFADEPTGALDHETSERVLELFKEINKKYKTTIIIVTHDEKIAKLADQIIHVHDGKITVK